VPVLTGIVEGCVPLGILNIDETFLKLGQKFHEVNTAKFAAHMQSGLSSLGTSIDLSHFTYQKVYYFNVLLLHSVMQRCEILVVLIVHVCTQVLMLLLIKQVFYFGKHPLPHS